jgi:toxin ParE1/3/4
MNEYEIIMTDDAVSDLLELRDYIAGVLLAPDTALSYIRSIRKEISTLSALPGRVKPVDEEPWHPRGIRRITANNFYVYYRIDENAKLVYVLNIIYSRRDQLRQLAHLKMD